MGFLDRLFGRSSARSDQPRGYDHRGGGYGQPAGYQGGQQMPQSGAGSDEQAIARYQYLLKTAPPEQIERAHEEAFAALTPQQRAQVLQQLSSADPAERPADDSPHSLARAATRQEMRAPGTLSRTFGGGMGRMGGGIGLGGALLASVAGAFVGSAIANEMFDQDGFMDWNTDGADPGQEMDQVADGGFDSGEGFDSGGGFSDFGGGDFGGGDFGGFSDF